MKNIIMALSVVVFVIAFATAGCDPGRRTQGSEGQSSVDSVTVKTDSSMRRDTMQ